MVWNKLCLTWFIVFLLGNCTFSGKTPPYQGALTIQEILTDFETYQNQQVLVFGYINIGTDTIELWGALGKESYYIFLSWQKINFADEGLNKKRVVLKGQLEKRPCGQNYVYCGVYLVDYGILHVE